MSKPTGKQAVLLIHGIGEQRPMDTLRGFVDTVWKQDSEVQHEHAIAGLFSKPDEISNSYELRRLSTTKDRNNVTTDFYEYYWAHLMTGTSLWHVVGWSRRILMRSPNTLPARLRGVWWLLMITLIAGAIFALLTVLPDDIRPAFPPKWLTFLLGLVFAWGVVPILKSFVGDAARYLDAAPTNVKARQEIRSRGIEILKGLHASQKYDRIIVVGHSLGSVIGYDILTYAWPIFAPQIDTTRDGSILNETESMAASNNVNSELYRNQQRQQFEEARANDCTWLVTDFVTLGSPLTHADVLLARDASDLKSKQAERELPTCPPELEKGKFSYPPKLKTRFLHHAALFGLTRWTNLYFPASYIIRGDFIGGPVSPLFGTGILDCEVHTKLRRGLLSHTLYWAPQVPGDEARIKTLRTALNLLDAGHTPQVTEEDDGEVIASETDL